MAALSPSKRLATIQRTTLVMLVVSGVINYADRFALSVANPLIRQDLGLSIAEMGVLLSAFLWAYAIAQLPVGAMVDRIGPRWLLGAGLLVWSIAQASAGLVASMSQFVVSRVILGIAEAPQFPLGARVVRDWFNVAGRGVPTGVFNSASTLGPAIAPPLLTGLMLALGWRWMFVVLGLLGILAAIVWLAIYRDRRSYDLTPDEWAYLKQGEPAQNPSPVTLSEWGSLFRFRTTWGMIFGNFGQGYSVWFYATWLPGYLEMQRHISIPHAGWAASVPYLFGVAGSLFGGWICDALVRRGFAPLNSRKLPIILGMLGSAAMTAVAAGVESNGLALAAIAISLFFGNIASASVWGLAVVAAPEKGVASLGAIQNFGGYLGGALAPTVTGLIVQRTSSFTPALLVAAALAVISALVYLFVVRRPVVLTVQA